MKLIAENIQQQFGKAIRKLRLEKGLSQEAFAAKCGLDRTYISSIERGKRNVALKNIALISSALDISMSKLFKEVDSDNPSS